MKLIKGSKWLVINSYAIKTPTIVEFDKKEKLTYWFKQFKSDYRVKLVFEEGRFIHPFNKKLKIIPCSNIIKLFYNI